ncbi:MAG TPA: hypothetical protein PLN52_22720 [Opitutaceae bacterium]|nr:hypothetical protein [Opitutaceae bacterium]
MKVMRGQTPAKIRGDFAGVGGGQAEASVMSRESEVAYVRESVEGWKKGTGTAIV